MSTSLRGGIIEQTLDRLGIDYDLRGDEAWAVCPMHEKYAGKVDHNPSWSINITSGKFFCFSCRYKGSINRLIQDIRGVSKADAEEFLGVPEYSPEVLAKRMSGIRRSRIIPVHSTIDEAEYLSFPDPPADELARRGLTAETAQRYSLRYDNGWLLPIRDPDGVLVGWQYKHNDFVRNRPPGVRKSRYLFGYHEAGDATTIVVVESPLDAALCTQHGPFPGVSTYGSMVSEEQVILLSGFDVVILAMDNPTIDKAGRIATEFLTESLQRYRTHVRVVQYPDHIKDFGDAVGDDQDLIPSLVNTAVNPLVTRMSMLNRKVSV